ncbi:ATP-binding cassette domain-containing protein [Shimia sediminis]|uniref:ATP-binding cassette domain-containing protein n=1 Tax=Shimia sediminis TaxID=2497945 RepID=UPI0013E053F3|nr:ATP-binding cassette domain-containing protein [Shimia sediminis]
MTLTSSLPHLDLSTLTKRFDSFTALSGISLQVTEGEFVCFVGPSGCGMTTLLRAVSQPDCGT